MLKAVNSADPPRPAASDDGEQRSRWRAWLARALAAAAIALAAFLLYRTLRNYTWDDVVASVAAIPAWRMSLALAFAAASYLCLTGFDWLATRYVGADLPYRYVALASFCSLSLGHNIGLAALSSGAIRYRFYSRRGVSAQDVAKIIVFCGATVALGLATLAGVAILLRQDLAREVTGLAPLAVLALGIACLAVPIAYLALAATIRRSLHIRRWSFKLPRLPLAAAQIAIGAINFAFVAACLHQVVAAANDVPYVAAATVYVIASAGALIAHAPGGLGVIETVVRSLLPEGGTIGALIAFRAAYYLVPLCIGGPLFAITELLLRRSAAQEGAADATTTARTDGAGRTGPSPAAISWGRRPSPRGTDAARARRG